MQSKTARFNLNKPVSTAATPDDQLLRAHEVARMLAVCTRLVWRLRSEGELPAVRIAGNATRFRLSDVRRLIQAGVDPDQRAPKAVRE
jgi:excisionase family DNA binding protein